MGDRTWLQVTLAGHIPSVAALDDIVAVLIEECLTDDPNPSTSGTALAEIAMALVNNDTVSFHDDGNNYASIDKTETVLMKHGVAYYVEHAEGSEYPAGAWSWTAERGRFETPVVRNDAVIYTRMIIAALQEADPVAAVTELAEASQHAIGKGMDRLTASDEVMAHLAPLIAKRALRIKEKA